MAPTKREVQLTKELKALANRALSSDLLKKTSWKRLPEFEIFFLDNDSLKSLKKTYYPRKKVEFVDVLSFPEHQSFPNPEGRKNFLGEIYLNEHFLKADRERAEFLIIHGLLHLLGYVHEKKNDIIRMERMERELLNHLARPTRHT